MQKHFCSLLGGGLIIGLIALKYFRVTVLQSSFGFVSQCKHSPTCGDNLVIQIRKLGLLRGSQQGLRQLAACR